MTMSAPSGKSYSLPPVRKIGNQWRLIVIRYLQEHPLRFNELLRGCLESSLEGLTFPS